MADDDARDERLAQWLEPEPLDEITRRRLVSTAMRESGGARDSRDSRAVRWIASAAAIVVVLVVGLALITAQGGSDDHDAATPVRTPASSETGVNAPSGGAAADSLSPQAQSRADLTPVDVGDFGDLDRTANRDRLQAALEGDLTAFAAGKAATENLADLDALPCRDQLPAGTVVAIGTGTLDGRAAVVVRTELGDGTRAIDVVLTGPCQVRPF